ncbi:DUF6916 family protein [Paeniglutamicibacter sp. R2-26]|uniref:DUF6916 family protein n=1 Tax=Paeniglutamicibacter sp. R2-26 TaxID=3144417 RepID=UPI003EE4B582
MRSPLTINRRHFLAAAAVIAVATYAGTSANATEIDQYALETWEPLVGSGLAIGKTKATLAACRRSDHGGFTLSFEAEGHELDEGIHEVHHPGVGRVDLFMTAHGNRALAVINRTQGAK